MRFTTQAEIPVAEYVKSREAVAQVCRELQAEGGVLGFDTETSGLEQDGLDVDCYCVGLASATRRVIIPTWSNGNSVFGDGAGNLEALLPFLHETQHLHAGYNWIYDANVLYGYTRWKLRQRPFQLTRCWADGMKLFCHFDEEGEDTYGQRRLKDRCRFWLGLPMNDFDSVVQGRGFAWAMTENFERSVDYAGRDAWGHLGLALLGKRVTEQMPWCPQCPECGAYAFHPHPTKRDHWKCPTHGWIHSEDLLSMWGWHQDLDVPFLSVLQRMQVEGLPVQWDYLADAEGPLRTATREVEAAFRSEVNRALEAQLGVGLPPEFNLNSDAQLRVLYHGSVDQDGKPVGFGYPAYAHTDSGEPSMKDDALRVLLARHQAPGVLALLERRKLSKILTTYVTGLQKRRFDVTGRLHGSFRPTTTTGRLRSADPNMQNFPVRDITVRMAPAATYTPTVEEIVEGWGFSLEEAAAELARPEYSPHEMVVNVRQAVRAPAGYKILCADYSQLEIRLTALESGCPDLIRVLNEGKDMHCYAAARAFQSVLQGAGYDEIYEAKQADDGDMVPRWEALLRLRDADVLSSVMGVRTCKAPEMVGALRAALADLPAALEYAVSAVGESAEAVAAWLQENAEDLYESAVQMLSLRDKELLNLRKAAKACMFGIIYGIGPTKLAAQITEATKMPYTVAEAKELIHSVKDDVFSGVGRMVERQKRDLREFGYVRTAMGRYRTPAGIFSGDRGRQAKAERQSGNSPIQGLAADIVQRAMLAIDVDIELRSYSAVLLSQVHDELLMLVPDEYADPALSRMKHLMETAHGLCPPVPLTVTGHAADTWDDAK